MMRSPTGVEDEYDYEAMERTALGSAGAVVTSAREPGRTQAY